MFEKYAGFAFLYVSDVTSFLERVKSDHSFGHLLEIAALKSLYLRFIL